MILVEKKEWNKKISKYDFKQSKRLDKKFWGKFSGLIKLEIPIEA